MSTPRRFLELPLTFWWLVLGLFVSRAGSFVFIYLALYLKNERGFSVSQAGAVVSAFGAGALVASFLGGVLADRIGRRPTILIGTILGSAALIHLSFARSALHVGVAAFLVGACAELYRPALQAAVADVVPLPDRARAYGYLYWAVNLAFSVAAVLAARLSSVGYGWLFASNAVTLFAFGVIVALLVPETLPDVSRTPVSIFAPYKDGVFVAFVVGGALLALVFHQGFSSLPLDLSNKGIGPEAYGDLIAVNGIMIVLLQPFISRMVLDRDPALVLALGAALTAIGFGATMFADTRLSIAITIATWTLGEIVMAPSMPSVTANLAPASQRGGYQGGLVLSNGIAAFLAPLLGTRILDDFGSSTLWQATLVVGLASSAVFLGMRRPLLRRLGSRRGRG